MEKIALSVPEMAEALGIGKSKAYELVNMAGFPAVRVGKKIIVSKDGLKRWLEQSGGYSQHGLI